LAVNNLSLMTQPFFQKELLQQSNELLKRVQTHISNKPLYLRELRNPNLSQNPISLPFNTTPEDAPNSVLMNSSVHDQNQSLKPGAPDLEAQNRLRSTLMQRKTLRRMDTVGSTVNLPEVSPLAAPPANEEPSEENPEIVINQKPLLDESLVMIGSTTTNIPEKNILTEATVMYPLQADNAPFNIRNAAEEGLWVPDLPMCKDTNASRIENRLLWSDPNRDHFFSHDNHMRIDTPPLQEIPPPFPLNPPTHDGRGSLQFSPASIMGIEEIETTRNIRIFLKDIKFLIHPLSSPEDILVNKIRQIYKAIMRDLEFGRSKYYKEKIEALRRELTNQHTPQEKESILKQLVECQDLRDLEDHNSRMLRDSLIQAWQELRQVRSNSITITPLAVRWQNRKFTEEDKQKQALAFEARLKRRALEICELQELQGQNADVDSTVEMLRRKHSELGLRLPGEAMWKPVLVENSEVTPLDQCTLDEQERRKKIGLARIQIRIIIGHEELTTPAVSMTNHFESQINFDIKSQVTQIPHRITFEIWETGYIRARCLASVSVPLSVGEPPDDSVYEFTSDVTLEDGQLIMGQLTARSYIVPDLERQQILLRLPDAPLQKAKRMLASDPSQFMSIPKLLEWAQSHDPNDPYMAAMLASIVAQRTNERTSCRFRLDNDAYSVAFDAFVPKALNLQAQIQLQRLQAEEESKKGRENLDDFKSNLKSNKIVKSAKVKKHVELTDVVRESPMPTLPSLFAAIAAKLFMFRPLRPLRRERPPSSGIETYSRIILRLVRGMNIPERSVLGVGPNTASSLVFSSAKEANTSAFARITFDGEVQNSHCVPGSSAEWNESLVFRVVKGKDDVPTINSIAKKDLRIDLFDKVKFVKIEDDRQQQTTQQIIEERFLGSLEFPVGTIWACGNVDGIISLQAPICQLGYKPILEPPKLAVFFTLDPPIRIDSGVNERESIESLEVKLRAEKWVASLKSNPITKTRNIVCMASPTSGNPFLACRMIKKQDPPQGFVEPKRIARFISLIPNLGDSEVFETVGDVWCTSQEFLDLNAGDDEEHACLMCNIFKSKSIDSYLVFGYSYDRGSTCYVLTKEAGRLTLWDPITARFYKATDRFCPLYSVGVVVNEMNIFANIQETHEPWTIDWNFGNNTLWMPFFSPSFPHSPFDSPQQEVVRYKPLDQAGISSLKRKIELDIRTFVEETRNQAKTNWNMDLGFRLFNILELCERTATGEAEASFQTIIEELLPKDGQYRMNGSPFCQTYTDVQSIIKEIQCREINKCIDNTIEFALAVNVVPYPNGIKAVWVFLATIQRITPGGHKL